MLDKTVPIIPTLPKIDKLSTARSTRIMFNYDPTPVFLPNEQWINNGVEPDKNGAYAFVRSSVAQEYCLQLKFTPSFMVYNGTENRSTTWHNGDKFDGATLSGDSGHYFLSWDREANNSDPLTPVAASGCSALAIEPSTFGAKLSAYMPLILDIESTKTYNQPIDTTEGFLIQIKEWHNRLKMYRDFLGYDLELYAYFLRGYTLFKSQLENVFTQEIIEADRAMMRLLSGINVGAYVYDISARNINNWFSWIDMYGGHIRENYPFHYNNKWATITPTYQIYWSENLKKLDGLPIPIDTWKQQIRYLIDRGWNIYLWLSPAMPFKPIKPHIDWLAKYLG